MKLEPTPETQHYWDGAREGKLLLQRCPACEKPWFPPRPGCPTCGSRDIEVFEASGSATLYSYVISHVAPPGVEAPFVVAIVELEEGPRMVTNVVGVEPDPRNLPLDLPLTVTFRDLEGDLKLPVFEPANKGET